MSELRYISKISFHRTKLVQNKTSLLGTIGTKIPQYWVVIISRQIIMILKVTVMNRTKSLGVTWGSAKMVRNNIVFQNWALSNKSVTFTLKIRFEYHSINFTCINTQILLKYTKKYRTSIDAMNGQWTSFFVQMSFFRCLLAKADKLYLWRDGSRWMHPIVLWFNKGK